MQEVQAAVAAAAEAAVVARGEAGTLASTSRRRARLAHLAGEGKEGKEDDGASGGGGSGQGEGKYEEDEWEEEDASEIETEGKADRPSTRWESSSLGTSVISEHIVAAPPSRISMVTEEGGASATRPGTRTGAGTALSIDEVPFDDEDGMAALESKTPEADRQQDDIVQMLPSRYTKAAAPASPHKPQTPNKPRHGS